MKVVVKLLHGIEFPFYKDCIRTAKCLKLAVFIIVWLLMLETSSTLKAQTIAFDAAVDMSFNLNIEENALPSWGGKIPFRYTFYDIDNDQDLDVISLIVSYYPKPDDYGYFYIPTIYLQENISHDSVIQYGDREHLFVKYSGFYLYNIADVNDDGLADMLSYFGYPGYFGGASITSDFLNVDSIDTSNTFFFYHETLLPQQLIDLTNDGYPDLFGLNEDQINDSTIERSFVYYPNQGNDTLPFDSTNAAIVIPSNDILEHLFSNNYVDSFPYYAPERFELLDIDQDADLDLVVKAKNFNIEDPYYLRGHSELVYFENVSINGGLDFDSEPIFLMQSKFENFWNFNSSYDDGRIIVSLDLGDVDGDGDLDIIEHATKYHTICGYCGGYTFLYGMAYHENTSELSTSLPTKSTLESHAYPIPSKDRVAISFENNVGNEAKIEVFSIDGKLLYSALEKEHKHYFSKQDFGRGAFLYKVTVGNKYGSGKLVFID